MLNFYSFYNKTGLDRDEYSPLIGKLMVNDFVNSLSLIEHIIKKNPRYSYWYAKDIIKDRWRDGEPIIMKYPDWAYLYAQKIIKDRWHEAEPYIKESEHFWCGYCDDFGIE